METVIIIWIICGIVAAVIAGSKGRSGVGWFFLGILLGPLGVLIIAVLPSSKQKHREQAQERGRSGEYRKCPYCAESIRKEAVKCRYCGSDVDPIRANPR